MHGLIQLENMGKFRLIDLGNSNETFLNKRRLHQPVRLHDQDKILIGGRQFIFREQEEIFTRESDHDCRANHPGDRECALLACGRGHRGFHGA
jgi:pSer/pThr/pTyr-binding forkhead associated (FHA) protein